MDINVFGAMDKDDDVLISLSCLLLLLLFAVLMAYESMMMS